MNLLGDMSTTEEDTLILTVVKVQTLRRTTTPVSISKPHFSLGVSLYSGRMLSVPFRSEKRDDR